MKKKRAGIQYFVIIFFLMPGVGFLFGQSPDRVVLAIHGGAGDVTEERIPPERRAEYEEKLTEALEAGYRVLQSGGSSLEAVTSAINILEDSPLFNAGRGAVLTNNETVEMDAAVMNGGTLEAGAVAGVQGIRNPINAAAAVLMSSPHVLLTGRGAEAFAREKELEFKDDKWFITERRLQYLREVKQRELYEEEKRKKGEETDDGDTSGSIYSVDGDWKYGTVGAVALDIHGNLSAGTSTGGMTNKRFNRIGDSPIIGAGTYANNLTCAVSATGHGEYFMRRVTAYDISAMMEFAGLTVEEAAEKAVFERLGELGGRGGVIALDAEGNVTMPFNTAGMFRGTITETGKAEVMMFGKDENER